MCNKEYSHTADLKKHYIDSHQTKDLKEKGVPLRALALKPSRYNTEPKLQTDTQQLVQDERMKRSLEINEETWQVVRDLEDFVPVLKLMAISGAQQSELPNEPREPVSIYEFYNRVYKRYEYSGLI